MAATRTPAAAELVEDRRRGRTRPLGRPRRRARVRARSSEHHGRARRCGRPRDRLVAAVAFTEENARRNGVALRTALVDWVAPAPLVAEAPWSLVLASDVLYERRNVGLLLELLPRLLDKSGEALLAEPGRPHASAFLAAAGERWRITSVVAPELPRGAV